MQGNRNVKEFAKPFVSSYSSLTQLHSPRLEMKECEPTDGSRRERLNEKLLQRSSSWSPSSKMCCQAHVRRGNPSLNEGQTT